MKVNAELYKDGVKIIVHDCGKEHRDQLITQVENLLQFGGTLLIAPAVGLKIAVQVNPREPGLSKIIGGDQ